MRMNLYVAQQTSVVMPGLVPGIHDFFANKLIEAWMAGTSPAMTA